MGDVSNYATSEYGPSDYQTIMTGGANWMARMTAFLEAQDRAQAAIEQAGVVGDINALRERARLDREAAAKELSDARDFADGIVAGAEKQAAEITAKARDEAEKIVSAAKDEATASAARVQLAEKNAQARLEEAQVTANQIFVREAESKARDEALDRRAKEIDDAAAEAGAIKDAYQTFAKKLRSVLDEEPKAGA